MPATVADAAQRPYPCEHGCFERLTLDERAQGIDALYRFDDAMRGWGFEVIWDLAAPYLWRVQQHATDARWVAVRDDACIYSRLVGFCMHELVHALIGDASAPNYGVPVGLPYGVPASVPVGGEEAYLAPFNAMEARAWTGGPIIARSIFGIEWEVLPARDVGTYGFVGGNALVEVPDGYRAVSHVDRQHHAQRYYAKARAIEDEARAWWSAAPIDEMKARVDEAAARGRASRKAQFPSAKTVAAIKPSMPGRNDLCLCGSGQKWKKCHGA
ncbi:MAG TPA: SEC-C domain-containing protein [Kofleriaceae bacterium]|nr:SEC-C domain-containing protein [Kofleriaceae bacterium]